MNMTIVWLVLLIVMIVVELATMGLTTIWFAGGSLVATIAAACSAPVWLQVTLFFVVSLILLWFTRPIAVKYFNKDRIRTNVEAMVGRQGVVTSEIDNVEGIGEVKIGGMEWTARTIVDGMKLPVGTVVIVRAVDGVKVIVQPK